MRFDIVRSVTAAGAALLAGCASAPDPLPLRPEPVPWADTLPIEEPPEQVERQGFRALLYHTPYEMSEPFRLSDPGGEALNRTHFDDVVSSAWFERRMGYEAIGPARLARAPRRPAGRPRPRGPSPSGTPSPRA